MLQKNLPRWVKVPIAYNHISRDQIPRDYFNSSILSENHCINRPSINLHGFELLKKPNRLQYEANINRDNIAVDCNHGNVQRTTNIKESKQKTTNINYPNNNLVNFAKIQKFRIGRTFKNAKDIF